MGETIVIANEHANWRASRVKVRRALEILRGEGMSFSFVRSDSPGHVVEAAKQAASHSAETVVVIGGDGTVNEAVNGLLTSGLETLPRLGIIPTGSSNDLAKSLGLPLEVHQACRTILTGQARAVDVGRAGSHYFCSASCLGYFAEIAARSHDMKGLRGSPRYVVAALSVLRHMDSGWPMEVRADGRTFQGDCAVLLVGNAPRFGGLTMLPGARPDDGLLDCLLIEMPRKLEALHLIALVYRKAMERHKKATRFAARSLSVTIDRPSRLCNDGELCPGTHQTIDYAVLPKRLRILSPTL